MFHEFYTPSGAPAPCALFEQVLCNGCVYWNQRLTLQSVIGSLGGGTISNYFFTTEGMPPSWAVWIQAQNVFVTFTGSVNSPQVIGDIVGSFATDYYGLGCQVHSIFNAQWNAIKTTILAAFPADWNNYTIHLFGHSMGGSIAEIAGRDLARMSPNTTVLTWSVGGPKILTAGLRPGPVPLYSYHTDNLNDPVPYLPPNGLISVLQSATPAFWGVPIGWEHYGSGFTLDANGTFTPRLSTFWDPFPSASQIAGFSSTHFINIYMQRAEILYAASCANFLPSLISTSQALRNTTAIQSGNWNVQTQDYIDIPWQNTNAFQQPPPGPLTSGNLGLLNETSGDNLNPGDSNGILGIVTGGGAVGQKFTFFYNIGELQGVSESWYSNANNVYATNLTNIGLFLRARMGISGQDTVFTYCRISTPTPPVSNRRLVQVVYPADLRPINHVTIPTMGTYLDPEGSNDPWSALLIRRTNLNRFSLGYVRGVPDFLDWKGGTLNPILPADFTTAFNLYAATVINNQWGWIGNTVAANSPCTLTGAAQQGDGTAVLTFAPNVQTTLGIFAGLQPGINTGVRTQLRISQQILPPGFNGQYTVNILTPTTCRTLRPLNVSTFVQGNGQGSIYSQALTLVASMTLEKFVSRKSGSPFGRSRGRRKNRVNG